MSSGGDDRVRLQQLQELLPDVPVVQLQRLVHSTNSLEHAVALHFSKTQHSTLPTSSPVPKATSIPSAQPREVHTIDDDDTPDLLMLRDEADGDEEEQQLWEDDRVSASNGEEHIEDEQSASGTDQHLSAPSSPHLSSAASSPAASPRKSKPATATGAKKRKGGSGGGGGSGSGGKKRRDTKKRAKDQRSIASFFNAGRLLQASAPQRRNTAVGDEDDTKEEVEEMMDGSIDSTTSTPLLAPALIPSAQSAGPSTSPLPAPSSSSPTTASAPTIAFAPSTQSTPSLSSISTPLPSTAAAIHALISGPPCWQPPNPVPYLHLARTFRAIEQQTGRILITNYLTLMLWRILDLSPLDLLPSVFLSLNHLAPPYENLQLHIGGSIVGRCVRDVSGRSREQMRDDFQKWGDLGDVAQQYKARQNVLRAVEPLTARAVYNSVYGLSKLVGAGNSKRKEEVVKRLLIACREYETCYLVRTVLQDMRIGGAVTTVLTAMAKAFVLHAHFTSKEAVREAGTLATWERVVQCTTKDAASPLVALAQTVPALQSHPIISSLPTHSLHALIRQATTTLRHCYSQHPNLRTIISALLSHPLAIFTLLDTTHLAPSVPCKPMLGKIAAGIHAMLRRMRGQPFSCEVKYDGLRAQIHMVKGVAGYRVFSRHLMEQSERWADLHPALDTARRKGVRRDKDDEREEVQSFIMDAEIVAVEVSKEGEEAVSGGEKFRILPFQAITTRKRKMDGAAVNEQRVEVRCMVYCFDLIFLNERPLLELSLADRRRLMYTHFDEVPAAFQFVEHVDVTQEESECIAIEEEDEGDDETTTKPTKGKRATKKDEAEEGESSASEQEEEVKEEVEDDPLFARKRTMKNGREKTMTQGEVLDDEKEVVDVEEEEEEKVAPTSAVVLSGKKKIVKLEQLTDEQVEKGAAAYQRVLSFLHNSGISRGEGLMTKSLSPLSQYLPDFRTDSWVKLKRDYIAGLSVGDALDVVPIGAWWGNGRKAGWYSPVLLAVYNPDSEQLETLCKCMSGFTDTHYQELVTSFAPRVIPRPKPYYAVDEQLWPTVWFDADRVWEIRGADLTLSPKHSAGRGEVEGGRGISLRFPRFIRVREDKAVEDATTTQQIVELFHQQSRKGGVSTAKGKRGTR